MQGYHSPSKNQHCYVVIQIPGIMGRNTMKWLTRLKGNPLPWLLEPSSEQPAVRFFVLTDLLDKPVDDPEVVEARRQIRKNGPVPVIFKNQNLEGYWAKPGGGYSPSYKMTMWQVIFLAELGADIEDKQVRRACEYLLDHNIAANGGFSMHAPPVPSGVIHCLNGESLYALLRLGFNASDERIQTALEWAAAAVTGNGDIKYYKSGTSGAGFACAYNQKKACAWGANKTLKALLAVPADQRSASMERALQLGVEFLLSRDPADADYPYSERVSSSWFRFGFPLSYRSDVLETASVLVNLDYGRDPRLANTLEFILNKQDDQGRWKMENSLNGKMWVDIEKKDEPSKWVTLRALRVIKQAYESK